MLLVATVVALLASVFAGAGFSATTSKPFKTDITPNSVAAGSSTDFTAKITNEASPQQLGSANITAPTGFTITGVVVVSAPSGATATRVGNVVQVRNLALPPGSAAIFTISAAAPSTPTSAAWTVTAKQSNDFNGPPGNDFTLDRASNLAITVLSGGGGGASQLHFFTEPADAAINTAITSTPFSPTGTSVQVEVLDGTGHRVTSSTAPITITTNPATSPVLTVTKNAVAGLASFTDLEINTHGVYTLIAQSPGITSAISNSITIWDSVQPCAVNNSCTASVGDPNTFQSQFSGTSSTGGFLLLTLGQDPLSCGDAFNHAPSVTTAATFHFSATGNKTMIGIIDKSVDQAQPNNGVAFYRVCFESDDMPFTYPGGVVHPKGTPFLLPDCKAVGGTPPCVKSITKTNAGDVLETITLPPDDGLRWK
ncbi:MAG TPA: hypothetical protein VIA11_06775 [Acidimicrobiia bacterium]|nr:hypothetical protein [Acidimicrobiia bacterium]